MILTSDENCIRFLVKTFDECWKSVASHRGIRIVDEYGADTLGCLEKSEHEILWTACGVPSDEEKRREFGLRICHANRTIKKKSSDQRIAQEWKSAKQTYVVNWILAQKHVSSAAKSQSRLPPSSPSFDYFPFCSLFNRLDPIVNTINSFIGVYFVDNLIES